MASILRIKQVKSSNGANPAQRDTLRTLGLRGIGSSTERPDEPVFRGLVATVGHLVEVGALDQPAGRPAAEDSDG